MSPLVTIAGANAQTTAPVVMPAHVQAAVNYISRQGRGLGVDIYELAEFFVEDEDNARQMQRFRADLNELVRAGVLAARGTSTHRTWAPAGHVWPDATTRAAAAPRWVGPIVPPRQVNVMGAPAYVPPADPPGRPGALDFARIASRGVQC